MAKNKYFGIDVKLDTSAAQAAASRMCEQQNLRVVFDLLPNQAPFTDGNTIHIESPHGYQTKAALNSWWAKLVHETRHNTARGRQCFDIAKRENLDMKGLHGFMFNLFEDTVVDNIGRGKYLGQDEASDWYNSFIFDQQVTGPKVLQNLWHNPEAPDTAPIIATGLLLDGLTRAEYMPEMIGKVQQFLDNDPNIIQPIRDKFDEIMKGDWLERLTSLALDVNKPDAKAEDVWQFVNDFLEQVFEQPPYEPPPQQGEGDPQDGDDDGNQQQAQGQQGDGNDDDGGQAQGKGDKDDEAEARYHEYIFEELARDDHSDIDLRKNRPVSGVDMDLKYGAGSGRYKALPSDRKLMVDYQAGKFLTETGQPAKLRYGESFDMYANNMSNRRYYKLGDPKDTLAQEVKRYIQSETRKKQTRNQKKGRLDKKKLFKLGVPDAAPDWQERVFWTLDNKYTVDNTVVSLLCDISGSMSGDKVRHAIESMDMLGDVCRALKINYEMAGFTTATGNIACHFLYKPFGVTVARSKIVDRMIASTNCMCANADGENIKIAYNRIRSQEAKRRVLIVLSDGYPAFRGGDISWYTNEVVKQIQEEGIVEVHGIGICSDSVRQFYQSYSVLNNSDELEDCLLTVLKNKILRFN